MNLETTIAFAPSYNDNAQGISFHSSPHTKVPHLGFVFTLGGKCILHMGDACRISKNMNLKEIDVAFVEPDMVVPPAKHVIKMHYPISSPYADLK